VGGKKGYGGRCPRGVVVDCTEGGVEKGSRESIGGKRKFLRKFGQRKIGDKKGREESSCGGN